MKAAGIDIGSRTIALTVLDVDSCRLLASEIVDSGYDPVRRARELASNYEFDFIVATGYGRHAAMAKFADEVITEITAYARGARYFLPEVRTILDIGGQDTKAILLGPDGSVLDFQMNEKCAAGTGKFLEVMAVALGYELEEFGKAPFEDLDPALKISSMCTVFAESEVVSLLHKGESRQRIARAVHEAIAERAAGLLKRIGFLPPVMFAGGVAKNPYLKHALEKRIGSELYVPEEPQIVGAVGSALEAVKRLVKKGCVKS
jgi:predicted CoA-substrate-specific enzyme activase